MSSIQMLVVSCPYCFFGRAYVEVIKNRGEQSVNRDPRKCDRCHRYFDIEVVVNVKGVALHTVDRNEAIRQSFKDMVEEQL